MRFLALPAVLALLALLPAAAFCDPPSESSPAYKVWKDGQAAMDGDRFEEAIGQFQLSLRLDPKLVQNHLSLAAAYLALGQDRQSLPHMAAYLAACPDHFLIRWHYAEVLMHSDQPAEARTQLERFVAEAQQHPRIADDHLIACHTRLMEIAERQGDDYTEHLHRGIGLYLLAQKRSELGDAKSLRVAEELLRKAAAELTLARMRRPEEARPCWYLYGVWTSLAQRQPALRWLRAAERSGPLNDLTPAEQVALHLAASERKRKLRKK